jgi:predicted dehydrogenase
MKFVIIGSGNIAKTYVNAVKNIDNAEIVGVVSRNLERAKKYAKENNFECAATSLENITCEYDAVFVATPNSMHCDGVVSAANLGKHALVEKPLDITPEHMDKMIDTCKKNNVKLAVSFQRRFSKGNIEIKTLLNKNAFGKIYAIDLPLKLYRGQEYYDSGAWRGTLAIDGGGPFLQQGSHDIDCLAWLFGMPKKVFARCGTFGHTGIEVEDHGAAIMEMKNGAICSIVASTIAKPGFSPRLEVFTEKGTFILENDIITTWEIEGVEQPDLGEIVADKHNGATSAAVDDTCGHEAVISDFIEAIETNREPKVTGEKARMSTDIILAIYKSSKEGREIELC